MLLITTECLLAEMHCNMVLLARSMEGLQETKAQVLATSPGISIYLVQADLGELDKLHEVFSEAARFADEQQHEQLILIHNAASLGDITKPIQEQTDPTVVQDYMAANFTSMFTLTAMFLSRFNWKYRTVVNMTSLLAVNYNYCFGFYSPGKAARNALMGVLAKENPGIRVLSYSPAVADTDMIKTLGEKSYSAKVTEGVKGLFDKKIVLSCQQSISKLVEILKEDKFESGTMIDYFDEVK